VTATERFAALLAALLTCVAIAGAGLRYLARISAQTGQVLERLGNHIRASDETDADHERRIRDLEQQQPQRRRR
jgi:hypothetical protein